jgi:signal transduction histidine kinase
VEVKVLDRGLGVPAGSGEKIFEQFYRAHDSLSNGIQGSGLGLTLARQIARAHGGDMVYEPRAGGGSCFTLRLPVIGAKSPTTGGGLGQ